MLGLKTIWGSHKMSVSCGIGTHNAVTASTARPYSQTINTNSECRLPSWRGAGASGRATWRGASTRAPARLPRSSAMTRLHESVKSQLILIIINLLYQIIIAVNFFYLFKLYCRLLVVYIVFLFPVYFEKVQHTLNLLFVRRQFRVHLWVQFLSEFQSRL